MIKCSSENRAEPYQQIRRKGSVMLKFFRSKAVKIIGIFFLLLVILIGSYILYVFTTYYRIEDDLKLDVEGKGSVSSAVSLNQELKITSWNVGFGAYTDQFSFFMDGGKYSRGFSREIVQDTVTSIGERLSEFDSDFYFLQEVDLDSTRSYHINEKDILAKALPRMSASFAVNYDSPYLFWPLIKPHGKSLSGIYTLSRYDMTSAMRHSLPVQTDFAKLLDLDRCYSVSRVPVENGKELLLYNVHLSAYTTDPTIADQQLQVLYDDMQAEYAAGNYILCGGDFNKDLLGDSSQIFGVSGEEYSWAQSFPFSSLPEGFSLIAPLDETNPVPSCRNADAPWDPETNFQLTIDGFIISENIRLVTSSVTDLQFACSDHNPVQMTFQLKE